MPDQAADDAARDRWLEVEVRHLAALAAIASEGSFRGAADSLGYVQSAVSQQLVQLERLIGARLIDRSRGTSLARPTAAGTLLLEHAQQILGRFRQAHASLAALTDGHAGPLRVAVMSSAAVALVPRIAPGFAARFPGVEIAAVEGLTQADVTSMTAAGDLDLAFCELPQPDPDLDTVTLMQDPTVLVAPADSPLTRRQISLADLAGLPLVGYENCRTQDQLLAMLSDRGITPRFVFRSDFDSTLEAAVAAGLGHGIMPRLALTRHRRDIAAVDLADAPSRVIALAWRRDRPQSLPARAFIALTRDLCRGITLQRQASRRNGQPTPAACG